MTDPIPIFLPLLRAAFSMVGSERTRRAREAAQRDAWIAWALAYDDENDNGEEEVTRGRR